MKIRSLLVLLFILMAFYACKKSNVTVVDPDGEYYFKASQNDNTAWSANPQISTYQDTLYIQGFAREESLTMKIKYNGLGTYTLTNSQAYDWFTLGGDAIISQYKLSNNTASTVTITSFDAQNKVATGTFDLKLVQYYPYNSAQLSFTSGKFRSAIK